MKEKHIVSFSGGKDSTAMLLKMLEKEMQIDDIICIDTTKEFPEMYDHINKIQDMINIKITTIEIPFDYYLKEHIKTKGSNKGMVGYGWPDSQNRWCTALKRQYSNKYIREVYRGYSIIEYQGIAADESHRSNNNSKKRHIKYPLISFKMSERDCIEFCYSKGLDWGGLYEKMNRVSCYCCPLSSLKELEVLYNEYPDLWDKMKEYDKLSFRKFRADYSLDQLEDRFKYPCLWRKSE